VVGRSRNSDLPLPSDQLVSRRHAHLRINQDGVIIEDLKSSNGTLIAGVNATKPTRLTPGKIVEVGDSLLSLSVLSGCAATTTPRADGTKVFNRQPRIVSQSESARLSIPVPPGERQDPTLSIVGIVLPLLIGGVMALLVKPVFILFALLSPVMALSTYVTNRRKGGRSHRSAVASYQEKKTHYAAELKDAIDREAGMLRTDSPAPIELVAIAGGPLTRLWERRQSDPDFLRLRIGLADRPSSIELIGGSRPDDPNSLPIEQPVLRGVPVTVDLESVGVLGLAGGAGEVQTLARWLVVQLATLQAPDDVHLVVLDGEGDVPSWEWSMWLPHLRMNRAASTATVGFGAESAVQLANEVAAIVDARVQGRESAGLGAPVAAEPSIVVVISASNRLRAAPSVGKLLRLGPTVGVSCICLADTAPQLPRSAGPSRP